MTESLHSNCWQCMHVNYYNLDIIEVRDEKAKVWHAYHSPMVCIHLAIVLCSPSLYVCSLELPFSHVDRVFLSTQFEYLVTYMKKLIPESKMSFLSQFVYQVSTHTCTSVCTYVHMYTYICSLSVHIYLHTHIHTYLHIKVYSNELFVWSEKWFCNRLRVHSHLMCFNNMEASPSSSLSVLHVCAN